MSVESANGRVIHYPANPTKFSFDAEVASLFDDMAPRSIPMYEEVHRMHVAMLRSYFVPDAFIVDVGSSTGRLFSTIETEMGQTVDQLGLRCLAIDSSEAMMDKVRSRFPSVTCVESSLPGVPDLKGQADIIFCLYTMQFVPVAQRARAMAWFHRNLKPNGVLVLGQKEVVRSRTMSPLFSEEYYAFRRRNGYTQAEIDAKTAALAGSMWPISDHSHESEAKAAGFNMTPSSRWLEFSTSILQRRK